MHRRKKIRWTLLCDTNPAALRAVSEQYGISDVCTDFRALLRRDDIDAVDVCLHANLHAPVTIEALRAGKHVLDYSEKMLEQERTVSVREGYSIEIVRADMTQPLPFADESFDLIFHPVSNCYVREVRPIWKECFRVLKRGGALLAGLDNGLNYVFDEDETNIVNTLPFDPLSNPEHAWQLARDDGGMQFSHTLEEQLGGQLEAGFRLTALFEDTNGVGKLYEHNIPTYVASRSVKP